jgi:hypothetical protein
MCFVVFQTRLPGHNCQGFQLTGSMQKSTLIYYDPTYHRYGSIVFSYAQKSCTYPRTVPS